jgi:nicotinate-nucleotide adenylyltransferase
MRIGLFGGTFNPIHFGHLRAALEVMDRFPLEACHLVPAAVPPHKTAVDVAGANHRLEMIRTAISGIAGLQVSEVELRRAGPSYTIDTVREVFNGAGDGTDIYLMIGMDAFLEIDTWKDYRRLLSEVPFVVMTRPGSGGHSAHGIRNMLTEFLHARLSADYRLSPGQGCFTHPELQPVYIQEVTLLDISSSKIRQLVKNGRSVDFLLPAAVVEYIKTRRLYL